MTADALERICRTRHERERLSGEHRLHPLGEPAPIVPRPRKREDNVVQFGIDELEGRLRALIEEVRFAADSLLEEEGFEL
jgi:hypothetical protein